jgi:hypothetical protein
MVPLKEKFAIFAAFEFLSQKRKDGAPSLGNLCRKPKAAKSAFSTLRRL